MKTLEHYSIQWQGFHHNIVTSLEQLKSVEDFVDVTLSCEGKTFKGHKVILSACSTYFRKILKENPCRHPVLILNDIQVDVLEAIMTYIYHGTVSLPHYRLQEFLKSAEAFKIKGIVDCFKSPEHAGPHQTDSPDEDEQKSVEIKSEEEHSLDSHTSSSHPSGDLSLLANAATELEPTSPAPGGGGGGGRHPPPPSLPSGVLPPSSKRRKTVPRKLGSFMSSSPARSAFSEEECAADTEKENKSLPDFNKKSLKTEETANCFLDTKLQIPNTSISQDISTWLPGIKLASAVNGLIKGDPSQQLLATSNGSLQQLRDSSQQLLATSNSSLQQLISTPPTSNATKSQATNSLAPQLLAANKLSSDSLAPQLLATSKLSNALSSLQESKDSKGMNNNSVVVDTSVNDSSPVTTQVNGNHSSSCDEDGIEEVGRSSLGRGPSLGEEGDDVAINLSTSVKKSGEEVKSDVTFKTGFSLQPTSTNSSNVASPPFQLIPSQLLNPAALKDMDKRTAEQMTAILGADQMAALLGPLWKSRQPRMCHYCNRMFSNKFNLKQHILNMHTVGREMQCEICNKKVKNKWYLRRHHVTHHGAPLKK